MNIDELDGLELIKAFAEALGFKYASIKNGAVYPRGVGFSDRWTELPADLILREFNRIKPTVVWLGRLGQPLGEGKFCRSCYLSTGEHGAGGPNLETALARLVVKLKQEGDR